MVCAVMCRCFGDSNIFKDTYITKEATDKETNLEQHPYDKGNSTILTSATILPARKIEALVHNLVFVC